MDIQWVYGIDLKMKKGEKWKTNVNVHLEMKLISGLEMKSNPKNENGNEKPN